MRWWREFVDSIDWYIFWPVIGVTFLMLSLLAWVQR